VWEVGPPPKPKKRKPTGTAGRGPVVGRVRWQREVVWPNHCACVEPAGGLQQAVAGEKEAKACV